MKRKNHIFLTIAFLLIWMASTPITLGQEETKKRIDSTLSTIESRNSAEEKEAAYSFLNKIILNDRPHSEELFKYALSKDSSDLCKLILFHRYSQKLSQIGRTDAALEIKLQGLEIASKRRDSVQMIRYHITVANAYLYQNIPDQALFHLNTAEAITDQIEDKGYLWNIYYHKGLLQNTLGNIEENTRYYEKMWKSFDGYENSPTKRFALYILVDHFSQIDRPLELATYTETLAQLYEEAHPNTPAGHMPIKAIFEKRADPVNIPEIKEAIKISDSLNSINSFTYSTIALANTYSKMKQPELAYPYLEHAINKHSSVKKPQILIHLLMKTSQLYEEGANYQNAYRIKIREARLRDSVNSEQMQKNMAELEVRFDTEKKEREIAEQKLTIEKEGRQKTQILFGLVALGVLLLFSLLFFGRQLKYQKTIAKQERTLQQQKIQELQQKNKLLALNSMIEGQEAERLRIAKDLHDSLGGLLSTVKAHFTTIQNKIEELEQLNITEKTNELIDEACLEVRRISHNMMPHALSISGLKGSIEDLADNLSSQNYKVQLEIDELPKMDTTKEVMLYRLIQEIISNIRKHAEAKNVLVQLLDRKESIHVTIEDDGKGFDLERATSEGGLGLKSINSRVAFLDGTIDWDTQMGRGTSIHINIPIS